MSHPGFNRIGDSKNIGPGLTYATRHVMRHGTLGAYFLLMWRAGVIKIVFKSGSQTPPLTL